MRHFCNDTRRLSARGTTLHPPGYAWRSHAEAASASATAIREIEALAVDRIAGASSARDAAMLPTAARAVAIAAMRLKARVIIIFVPVSTLIHHDIEQRRLAALDHGNCTRQRRRKRARVADRAFAIDAGPLGNGRIVDKGILQGGADIGVGDAAAMTRGQSAQQSKTALH